MRRTATIAGMTVVLLALTSTTASTLGILTPQSSLRPGLGTRQGLELLVMGLQVAGVLALGWMKLMPGSTQAAWSLIGLQVGLGVAGAWCAGFESRFALYAGATLMLLLLGAMVQTEESSPLVRSRSVVVNG